MRKNGNRPNRQIWEIVAEGIKEDIINRRYRMGEWLRENEVAEKYGSSKTPVKEALRYLEGIGFVEITPYTGARVRMLNKDELLSLYKIQGVLEGYAASVAAPKLTEKRMENLKRHADALKQYHGENKAIQYERTNLAFHNEIWDGLVDNKLQEMILHVRDQLQRSRSVTRYHLGEFGKTLASSHDQIVEALQSKDGHRIEEMVRSHYAESGEIVARLVEIEEYNTE